LSRKATHFGPAQPPKSVMHSSDQVACLMITAARISNRQRRLPD
jgi:hypothetical protein